MGRVLYYLLIIVLVVVGAALAWAVRYAELDPVEAAGAEPPTELTARGAALAAAGNCGTCHTVEGGAPFAGGRPIPTPFGTIYATNITPDPETGIGRWSEAAFRRAMREGVDREGNYLYPAFPYDHFTKLTDEDIEAIYAYLTTRPPVEARAPENELSFPFNFRLLVAGWNLLYLDRGAYQPEPGRSDDWNRGAYLVEGLGHCGSCHTPRNALGAEEKDRRFGGGFGEGWIGPALDASSPAPVPWTAEQIEAYLRHGWQALHGPPLGPMAEVANDLRQLPREDLAAIGAYLASFQPRASEEQVQEAVARANEREWTAVQLASLSGGEEEIAADPGALIFAGACAICHHRGGRIPYARPVPLGLSTSVNLHDPTNFLQIVIHGLHPEPGTTGAMMPAFGDVLSDDQIAALSAYVRSRFTDEPDWGDLSGAIENIRQGRAGP